MKKKPKKKTASKSVTIALTPKEVEVLIFALRDTIWINTMSGENKRVKVLNAVLDKVI